MIAVGEPCNVLYGFHRHSLCFSSSIAAYHYFESALTPRIPAGFFGRQTPLDQPFCSNLRQNFMLSFIANSCISPLHAARCLLSFLLLFFPGRQAYVRGPFFGVQYQYSRTFSVFQLFSFHQIRLHPSC